MSSENYRSRVMILALTMTLALVLLPSAALAAWTTIDTDNGEIDSTWGTPTYSDACGNDGVADQKNEIKNAWFKSDGDFLYFRMETCGTAVLSDTTMRAVGALDCNRDGDFADPSVSGPDGDRLVVYRNSYDEVNLLDGKYSAMLTPLGPQYVESIGANLEWRIDISLLPPTCRGSTTAIPVLWATAQVVAFKVTTINQSKQTYAWSNPIDYGDLPNPDPNAGTCEQYPSRLPCDGPRHGVDAGAAILGVSIDPDTGGLYDTMASLDDTTNTGATDDEDGVAPATGFAWTASGGKLDVTVSGGSGYLSCWIDWNSNYSFADAGDQVVANLAIATGTHSVNITTATSVDGPYYARCRLSPVTGASTTGPIYGGEVEDYRWLPQASALTIAQSTTNPANAELSWTEVNTADTYNIYRSTLPYQQPSGTPVNVADSPYSDPVLGAPVDMYFYVMTRQRTVDSATMTSMPSNEVGVFEFALVTGS